jgi:hypothetical protein
MTKSTSFVAANTSSSATSTKERPIKLIFNPENVLPERRSVYEVNDVEVKGSYLWLKNEIKNLGYPENVFGFDDDTKTIRCYAPLQYFKHDYDLIWKIGTAFGPPFQTTYILDNPDILRPDAKEYLSKFFPNEDESSIERDYPFRQSVKEFFETDRTLAKPYITNFESLLSGSFCVGEVHSSPSPKRFLIENMSNLRDRGYSTLFLEHLFHNSVMQDALDEYLKPPADKEMPKDLQRYLTSLDYGFSFPEDCDKNFNFCKLVEAAKNNGIRIVGIDTEQSYDMGLSRYGAGGDDRTKGMNCVAYNIIRSEAREGKWVALMGNTHIGKFDGVPGVSEMLGVASVNIFNRPVEQVGIDFGAGSTPAKYGEILSDVRICCARDSDESLKIETLLEKEHASRSAEVTHGAGSSFATPSTTTTSTKIVNSPKQTSSGQHY